ncbi:MAG TPA: PilT/PilU family type 4a pilus ATPase [Acidobacteriota bacterium]|nr:PilT/PilU family type 4a pilus ATPase [Acidobacteriota bacterium]
MIDLRRLLKTAIENDASDIHVKAGALPHMRILGELRPAEQFSTVTKEDTLDLAQHLLNARQREALTQRAEIDLSFSIGGVGRFRLAVFHQRGAISMVMRVISDNVPGMDELNLPPALADIAEERRGLVMVTGTTGSGKSTTLAAMIQHVNQRRPAHIITIEDPIEYYFRDDKSFISQREVNLDTENFAAALRGALRQDPDIVMVGEMRDYETVQTALQAAETGHLVMSTLHTTDTIETINRVIAIFPDHQQQDIRFRLASSLRAIISMRLIRSSIFDGRVPAVEILRNTDYVRSIVEDPHKTKEIKQALETGYTQYGMQSFDRSIFDHFQEGRISREDALSNASSPEDLQLRIRGIVSSTEQL